MMLLTQRTVWKALEKHAEHLSYTPSALAGSCHNSKLVFGQISLDFSAQYIDQHALDLLYELADNCQVKQAIAALMTGEPVNNEKPALHTALRANSDTSIYVDSMNIMDAVTTSREQMRMMSEQIRRGEWLGFSGKPVVDVVNIGIGGSQLGPQFCLDAFKGSLPEGLRFHFISDFDQRAFDLTVQALNPETTLFIVSSKSFTTPETLLNAERALLWINHTRAGERHFIAVTACPERARHLGLTHVIPIWEWVGGRYSVCSAINLTTCIALGFSRFEELLQGARSMDEHCLHAPLENNLPVLLALLGVWNNNILKIHTLVLLTYAQALQWFVPYVQQLDMESNGKSLDRQGRAVNYATGPIVWGGLGNQGQHSYFQLLCQGTHRVAIEMVSLEEPDAIETRRMCRAHQHVLSQGVQEGNSPYGYIPGNMPINHLGLADCSPYTLGALIALYEHKVYIQSVIWNINAFDQPGVDSLKQAMRQFVGHAVESSTVALDL